MTRSSAVLAGLQAGRQAAATQANIDLTRAQLQNEVLRQQELEAQNQLTNLANQGDPIALQRLATINPQRATEIQNLQVQRANRGAQLGQALLSAPVSQRSALYPRLLEQARREGLDVSGLPSEYSPEAEQIVRFNVSAARDIEKQIEAAQRPAPLSPEGKLQADIRAGLVSPDIVTPDTAKKRERVFKQTSDLRKEFTKASGEFVKSKDAFDRVQASAQDPSAAGDLALIFNFMKVLDPGSTVREGEFANAQNSGGVSSRIRAQYNKVLEGKRLSSEQRNDFVNRSERLFNKALKSQETRINQFRGIAERNNLPTEDVIIDLVGGDPDKQAAVSIVEAETAQAPRFTREQALAELERRRRQSSLLADNGRR